MKGSDWEIKNADSVKISDIVSIYGHWCRVDKVKHINKHPFQLYEFYFKEFDVCLRIPAGWQIRIKKVETPQS